MKEDDEEDDGGGAWIHPDLSRRFGKSPPPSSRPDLDDVGSLSGERVSLTDSHKKRRMTVGA